MTHFCVWLKVFLLCVSCMVGGTVKMSLQHPNSLNLSYFLLPAGDGKWQQIEIKQQHKKVVISGAGGGWTEPHCDWTGLDVFDSWSRAQNTFLYCRTWTGSFTADPLNMQLFLGNHQEGHTRISNYLRLGWSYYTMKQRLSRHSLTSIASRPASVCVPRVGGTVIIHSGWLPYYIHK